MASTLLARGRRTKKLRIFELFGKGLDNGQIAERLNVAKGTVENWRTVWTRENGAPADGSWCAEHKRRVWQ